MQRIVSWRRQFNWRMLLVRIVVNALALFATVALVPRIYLVDRERGDLLVLGVTLGILNAVVKPVIQVVTLRFIFATFGVVLALIDAIMLLLLERIFPNILAIDGFVIVPLIGGAVLGLVSVALESLLGLSPPIVSERQPELRDRIRHRQTASLERAIAQSAAEKSLALGGGGADAGPPEAATSTGAAAKAQETSPGSALDPAAATPAAPAAAPSSVEQEA